MDPKSLKEVKVQEHDSIVSDCQIKTDQNKGD